MKTGLQARYVSEARRLAGGIGREHRIEMQAVSESMPAKYTEERAAIELLEADIQLLLDWGYIAYTDENDWDWIFVTEAGAKALKEVEPAFPALVFDFQLDAAEFRKAMRSGIMPR